LSVKLVQNQLPRKPRIGCLCGVLFCVPDGSVVVSSKSVKRLKTGSVAWHAGSSGGPCGLRPRAGYALRFATSAPGLSPHGLGRLLVLEVLDDGFLAVECRQTKTLAAETGLWGITDVAKRSASEVSPHSPASATQVVRYLLGCVSKGRWFLENQSR